MTERILCKAINLKAEEEEIPPPPALEGAALLGELKKIQIQQENQLNELFALQRDITIQKRDEFNQLRQRLFKLHQQITQQLKELEGLMKKDILTPVLLASVIRLTQLLQLQQQKTDLLLVEQRCIATEEHKW